MDDFFDNWTVQVRKGLLELCILNALASEERYGYELVKTLVAIPGQCLETIPLGEIRLIAPPLSSSPGMIQSTLDPWSM